MKSSIVVGTYAPPDVRVKTTAKRVRGVLETTRQNRRPLVELCFLFIRVHVIKSDGLGHSSIGDLARFTASETHSIPRRNQQMSRVEGREPNG